MTGAKIYQKTQAETASKERLMVMLFDAALRHMRHGAELLEHGKTYDAVTPLTKASDIVIELHATLDPRHAPELCEQLAEIYRFVSLRLTHACLTRNPIAAREAERAFAPIAGAFAEAVAVTGAR